MAARPRRVPLLQVCAAAAALHSALVASSAAPAPDVDIVIPASCPGDRAVGGDIETMTERERDNGELLYTLKSIQKNANWVRKIFVLQNPGCQEWFASKTLPEPEKTTWLNRCSLFPAGFEQDCPSRNSFAIMTVVHRVPDLAELFVFVADDCLVVVPTTVDSFFAVKSGTEEYLPQSPRGGHVAIYEREPFLNDTFTAEDLPLTELHHRQAHTWLPMKRAVGYYLETTFPKFVTFVRSHYKGRYSSVLDASGTSESEKWNSLEENMQGVWWFIMREQNMSVLVDNDNLFRDNRLVSWQAWDWMSKRENRTIVNINDDFSIDPESYEAERAEAHQILADSGFALLMTQATAAREARPTTWRRARRAGGWRLRGAAADGRPGPVARVGV